MTTKASDIDRQAAKQLERYEIPEECIGKNGHIKAFIHFDGMTPTRNKLLSLLSLPQSNDMSVTEKCRIAGIDRQTWYNCMANEEFCDALKEIAPSRIGMRYVPGSIHAIGDKAEKGDVQAFDKLMSTVGLIQKGGAKTEINIGIAITQVQQAAEKAQEVGLSRFKMPEMSDN